MQEAYPQILANCLNSLKASFEIKEIMTFIESRLDCSTPALHIEEMFVLVTMRKKLYYAVSILKKSNAKRKLGQF